MKRYLLSASAMLLALPLVMPQAAKAQTTPASAPPAETAAAPESLEEIQVHAFISSGANSATKLDVPTRDTPFSVASYTDAFIEAVQSNKVSDLYRYMTGLERAGATAYDMTLRGFHTTIADRNAFMTDGLPGLATRYGSPPTVGTERIEVVKGAASLLYGQVQPGGFVNIISKKPSEKESTDISISGNQGVGDGADRMRGYTFSFDTTGPIDSEGQFAYRVVGEQGDNDGFRQNYAERPVYFAPSLLWNVDDNTTATFQLEYRATTTGYQNAFLLVPTTGKLSQIGPYDANYTNPGGYQLERGETATFLLSHVFDNGWTYNFSYRDVHHMDSSKAYDVTGFDPSDPTQSTLDSRGRAQQNIRTYNFGDTNVVVPIDTFGIGNKIIAGLSLGRETTYTARLEFCPLQPLPLKGATKAPTPIACDNGLNSPYVVNIFNPNYNGFPSIDKLSAGTGQIQFTSQVAQGAYISDLITLTDQLKATVGLRFAHEKQILSDQLTFKPTQVETANHNLPQAGLLYQPTEEWTFYTSYSTSFTPVPVSNANPQSLFGTFKPTTGSGYEAGFKAELLKGRLNVTGALFRINQQNVLSAASCLTAAPGITQSTSCFVQSGGARSDGAELEVSAAPIDHLTVTAGYAYTDAFVTSSTSTGPLVGSQLVDSPHNAFHLWSRYDFTEGAVNGLGVGLGYSYTGDRLAVAPTGAVPNEIILPSYQVVDMALYYLLPYDTNMTFKVSNLTNKHYYESGFLLAGTKPAADMANIQPGVPRYVTLSFDKHF